MAAPGRDRARGQRQQRTTTAARRERSFAQPGSRAAHPSRRRGRGDGTSPPRALLTELDSRRPGGRATKALAQLDLAVGPQSDEERLAWLIELRGDTTRLASFRAEIDSIVDQPLSVRRTPALLAAPVATLFGSLNPNISAEDLHALFTALTTAPPAPRLVAELDRLAATVPADQVSVLPDGAAGGELGDAAASYLPLTDGRVQIVEYLVGLGLMITRVGLQDGALRAVTALHDDTRAVIVINSNHDRGVSDHVVRFTLAHELAHLVYDRLHARTLAVASGPWAPPGLEMRANGFAAGLLMPETLLRDLIAAWHCNPSAGNGPATPTPAQLHVTLEDGQRFLGV